jgi:dihydrofolate synthase/folylpolyglutamate synthase
MIKKYNVTLFYYRTVLTKSDFIITSDLRANYQQENLITVYQAIQILQKKNLIKINDTLVNNGFLNVVKNTSFIGRWQQLQSKPIVIADVGHNEAGVQKIIEQLQTEKYNKLHIIYGAVKDKDIDAILALLPKNAIYYFTEPPIPRKLDVDVLLQNAKKYNLIGDSYANPKLALSAAKYNASDDDIILITGSFFIVAEIL